MRPQIEISMDGQNLSSKVNPRVLNCEVRLNDGQHADTLTLSLSNFDGRLQKPTHGAHLTVSMGFEGAGVASLGTFIVQEVTKIGAAASFEITGQAADLKTTLKAQKNRAWTKGETLGQIMQQIAGNNGLSLAVSADLAALKPGHVYQSNESDMHLVTRLAALFGAIGKPIDGRLVVAERGTGLASSGAAMTTITVTPNDLEGDFRMGAKDRPHRGKVKAHHYDRATAKRSEVAEGDGDGPDYVIPRLFPNAESAQRACKGRKGEFTRGERHFSGTFKSGDNRAKPGVNLVSQGFGDDDDTSWIVKNVTHSFSDGYVTKFEAELKK